MKIDWTMLPFYLAAALAWFVLGYFWFGPLLRRLFRRRREIPGEVQRLPKGPPGLALLACLPLLLGCAGSLRPARLAVAEALRGSAQAQGKLVEASRAIEEHVKQSLPAGSTFEDAQERLLPERKAVDVCLDLLDEQAVQLKRIAAAVGGAP